MADDLFMHIEHHAINCPANGDGLCNCGARVSVEVPNPEFERAFRYLMALEHGLHALERLTKSVSFFQDLFDRGELPVDEIKYDEFTQAIKDAAESIEKTKGLKYG